MENNWYVSVNGETYGPYTWEKMYEQSKSASIIANTLVYHKEIGQWVEAWTITAFGLQSVDQHNSQQQMNSMPTQRSSKTVKKKSGCLKGCLTVTLIAIVGVMLISVFIIRPMFNKEMIDFGRPKVVAKEKIGSEGGTLIVDDVKSDIDGLIIHVPEDVYDEKHDFKVSTREIKNHEYGDLLNPILPVIHVDNGGEFSNDFMYVSIPIDIDDNLFAMALYYNEDGSLEPIPMISQSNDELVIGVRHFSDVIITALPKALLDEFIGTPKFDSGYIPGVDNWPFINNGTEITPVGNCNGMSLSSVHYYLHHKKNGQPSLHTLLDNNYYKNTTTFDNDDSQGIRLTTMVQKEAIFKYTGSWYFDAIHKNKFMTDKQVFYHFAYAFMLSDNDPQLVGLFKRKIENNKPKIFDGHAIVAYKMDEKGIYVCDPNYPDKTDLMIPFNGEVFGDYMTATSANIERTDYNSFSLLGTTSQVPASYIENLFDDLKENPYESTIGDSKLSNPLIYYLAIDEGELYWSKNVEGIVITPEDAAIYKKSVLEFIKENELEEELEGFIPSDWGDKKYILVKMDKGYDHPDLKIKLSGYSLYVDKGEEAVLGYLVDDAENTNAYYDFLPIDIGANNLGIEFLSKVEIGRTSDNQIIYGMRYSDFQRIQIVYGEIDLTGTWEGEFVIENIDKAMNYAEDLAFQITKGISWAVGQMTGQDFTKAELEEIARSSIEVNDAITDPIAMTIILTNKKGNIYDAKVTTETDGVYEYNVKAEFNGEAFIFTLENDDGSEIMYTYHLFGNNNLNGNFTINYGSVSDFVSGSCYVERK